MKPLVTLAVSLLLIAAVCIGRPRLPEEARSTGLETRCGWFANPTPANAWLYDRDGAWIIGVQGGYQADGEWPNFKARQWVRTNGNYGYGCACLQLRVNKQTHVRIRD